jgi:hypothetical protein
MVISIPAAGAAEGELRTVPVIRPESCALELIATAAINTAIDVILRKYRVTWVK